MNNPEVQTTTHQQFSTQNPKTSTHQPVEEYIIEDHNEIRALIDKYFNTSDRTEAMRWYNQFVWNLARHSHAEELILYPFWRKDLAHGEDIVKDSIEDHQKVKKMLVEIQSLNPLDDQFRKKVETMWSNLRKHLEEEENVYLAQMRQEISLENRISYGKSFENRKFIVPTRPHLSAPENLPTLEAAMGLILAPIDKLRDLFTSFPDQDKVNKVLTEFEKSSKDKSKI